MGEISPVINSVQNHWQFMSLCVIAIVATLYVYWMQMKKESDALLSKARELEEARTLVRKQDRDKQLENIQHHFECEIGVITNHLANTSKTIEGVGHSLDRHVASHEKVDTSLEKIGERLKVLEENSIKESEFRELRGTVNGIDKRVEGMDARLGMILSAIQQSTVSYGRRSTDIKEEG